MRNPNLAAMVPCNPNASKEVKAVLRYLSGIAGKAIITGQHTQTNLQKELQYIEKVTGGFLRFVALSC